MPKTRKSYLTPLSIPAQTIGEHKIVHEIKAPGEQVMLSTWRNAVMGGQKGKLGTTFDKETRWHKLIGPSGTWMTDFPVEQRQHDELLKGVAGRVLVGGLGLGYAVTTLATRHRVKEIVVVEISEDVIALVGPYTRHKEKMTLLKGDLLQWLKDYNGEPFDFAFFDIWQLDGEATFFETVVPLHQLSKGKVKTHPINWNEDVMRGQLASSLRGRLLQYLHPTILPENIRDYFKTNHELKGDIWHDWQVPFWKWYKEKERDPKDVDQAISFYAGMYGRSDFDEFWSFYSKKC